MTIIDLKAESGRTLEQTRDSLTVDAAPEDQPTTATAPEAAKWPAWLPDGCPSWCEVGDAHKDKDHIADRFHFGPATHITLTAEEPPLGPGVTPDGKGWTGKSVPYDDPAHADVYLLQHYRELGPRLWVGRADSPIGINLTLDEAERVALEILKRVAAGRLKQSPGDSPSECPSWCIEDHTSPQGDDEHIGKIYGVALAAYPYTVSTASGDETYHSSILASIYTDKGKPPHISLTGHDGKPGSHLTPDEADQIADMLHTLAATVRNAQQTRR
ncbi:DUF6907 domain-containing protein [Actinomadura sp. 9N407]|uniref:DUF6907 domain-containing protein n=1 Tax=Actinomadura sp. 9N407 TaxID=3375154 RepID=UPI00379B31B7